MDADSQIWRLRELETNGVDTETERSSVTGPLEVNSLQTPAEVLKGVALRYGLA